MQGQMPRVLGVVPQASDSVEAFLHLKQQVLFRIILFFFNRVKKFPSVVPIMLISSK